MNGTRYAVYFVPDPQTALYRFGAAMIGYDCYEGRDVDHPPGLGFSDAAWRAMTEEPRRYGFHATLKAPFRLHAETDEPALIAAFDRFAQEYAVAPEFLPEVRLLAGFAAIMPRGASTDLSVLADSCVTAFEPFRAPLTAAERERRIAAGLSGTELANLDRWGYPYVFQQFRFHMTLTGSLPGAGRGEILAALEQRFARAHRADRPIRVDRLALVRQAGAAARFLVLRLAQFGVSG